MKEIIQGFYKKKNFGKRFIIMLLAVLMMGFSLSWLLLVDLGPDPCTLMNLSIANKIGWTIGNWQATLNVLLLILVLIFGGRNIGFGTFANMFLIGYTIDFCSWIWGMILPANLFESWTVRILVLIPALVLFIISAALYMDMDLGTSPYDAISFILSQKIKKVSFRMIRIGYDFTVIVIGLLFGGKLGIVTILMAITLGPVIEFLGKAINKKWSLTE